MTERKATQRHTSESFKAQFMAKIQPDENGCHLWMGRRSDKNYGQLTIPAFLNGDGKSIGAHRMRWILEHGAIQDGLYVCHKCNNPPCCNPEHLYLATHRPGENMSFACKKCGCETLAGELLCPNCLAIDEESTTLQKEIRRDANARAAMQVFLEYELNKVDEYGSMHILMQYVAKLSHQMADAMEEARGGK